MTVETLDTTPQVGRGPGVLERRCRLLGDIERRSGLSPEELQREYLAPRKPVVLAGDMNGWAALERWSFDWFRRELGEIEIPVGRLFERQGTMKLGEYVDYVEAWRRTNDLEDPAEPPLYADGCFIQEGSPLAADFSVPRSLADIDWFGRYLKSPMGLGYLLIGPKGSMTKLHIDGQYSHAWVAQVVGRKRWHVIPFDQLRRAFRGYAERIGGYPGMEPPGIEELPGLEEVGYYSTVLEPGEIIVAPSAQFHEVINLDDSIALTNNFVDRTNAARVCWSFFLTKIGLRKTRRPEGPAL